MSECPVQIFQEMHSQYEIITHAGAESVQSRERDEDPVPDAHQGAEVGGG